MRYVIILGDRAGLGVQVGDGWLTALSTPRALVLARAGVATHSIDGSDLVVVGNLHSNNRQDVFRTLASVSALSDLLSKTWGRYVATMPTRDGVRWQVLRDPSGRLPCFYAKWRGAMLVFSDLRDARAVGWRDSGPDWNDVAAFVEDARIRDGRSGLTGVRELLPGSSLNEDGECEALWRPGSFVHDLVEDRTAARRLLRDAVLQSVSDLARDKVRILHLLSGGLDSSVVLSCLRQTVSPDRLTCLTFTQGDGSELDELKYARMAAEAAGVELLISEFKPSDVRIERALEVTDQPRPLGYVFSIENDDAELTAAQRLKPSVCTSGAGGDGLFFQLRAKTYCADYFLSHGLSPGALRVALDNARLARTSLWTIVREGWRLAYGSGTFDPAASMRNPYLAADLGSPGAGWLRDHPWFKDVEFSPGKRLHAWAVLDCLNLSYPYRRADFVDTELVMVSQPIIEAVLRIPSWVLSDRGRDRTLLREAFEDIVPSQIIGRTGKGAMDGYYAEVCAANALQIREQLLDGALVKHGIVNSTAVERDLPRAGDPRDGRELLLLQLYAVEAWASAWSAARATIAA